MDTDFSAAEAANNRENSTDFSVNKHTNSSAHKRPTTKRIALTFLLNGHTNFSAAYAAHNRENSTHFSVNQHANFSATKRPAMKRSCLLFCKWTQKLIKQPTTDRTALTFSVNEHKFFGAKTAYFSHKFLSSLTANNRENNTYFSVNGQLTTERTTLTFL